MEGWLKGEAVVRRDSSNCLSISKLSLPLWASLWQRKTSIPVKFPNLNVIEHA